MVDGLERYVTYLIAERNVSPYTLRNYRTEIGQFIEYAQSHGVKTWDQAVSYTHLDVYKRQVLHVPAMRQGKQVSLEIN